MTWSRLQTSVLALLALQEVPTVLAEYVRTLQLKVAPVGSEVLTVGVVGDYGWTGWKSSPPHFCLEVLPELQAAGLTIANEVLNDCDPGDITYINYVTALQIDTSSRIGQVCAMKNCTAFVSIGDNFYDSGIDFTSGGIQHFQEARVGMYSRGIFESTPWYQCLGNYDIVKGQSGVDFQTKVAPIYDSRRNFVAQELFAPSAASADHTF
ncbi:hypothetical protein K503DRAFT_806091 [Rhizopogon vinicolor AM-OR11-026]|uniref:Metallo-dependent phosphatase n=1 Tax=Rhizopogon vinicolor AM-OR11-026 TaxID=1314800 RepID=A0A1B7MFN0_9AGAM|nr:hypothetical protein K503DRAFT_806091 [Rhizopogon vinicolor AM-OR11-026]